MRVFLTPAERELLVHLIHAEAATEPYEGQVAVAAVIEGRRRQPIAGVAIDAGRVDEEIAGRIG